MKPSRPQNQKHIMHTVVSVRSQAMYLMPHSGNKSQIEVVSATPMAEGRRKLEDKRKPQQTPQRRHARHRHRHIHPSRHKYPFHSSQINHHPSQNINPKLASNHSISMSFVHPLQLPDDPSPLNRPSPQQFPNRRGTHKYPLNPPVGHSFPKIVTYSDYATPSVS